MSSEETPAAPRQTLAMRLAERERQRALRAERLARLRPAAEVPAPAPEADAGAEAALEDFLRALAGAVPEAAADPVPATAPVPAGPGAVLHFQRPERGADPAAGGLGRLPGAGPGLVWALERAGFATLADIAALAPEALADRLGPIGRLVPAGAWIAAARAAVPAGDPVL